MSEIKIGEQAPTFKAQDQSGNHVALEDFKGKKVVLYFYPKDDTPGCTKEACSLRDNYNALIEQGYAILGVSPDDVASHEKFVAKYNLPFQLLADTEKEIANAYGVWVEKNMYGRKSMGIKRTTFVIDENGAIAEIIKKVDTEKHAEQILK